MKKIIVSLLITLLILQSVLAINLGIEKQSSNEVMILDLDEPAIFDLQIKNNGPSDNFQFYTFFTPTLYPKGTTSIATGETKNVQLEIYPPEKIKSGYTTFDYFIKSQDGSEMTQTLLVNVINLEDAFEIGSGDVDFDSNTLNLYVHNKVGFNFKKINAKFTSPFFNFEKEFSLEPNQRQDFSVELKKEEFNKLKAGYYTFKVEFEVEDVKAELEEKIKFVEKNIVTTTSKDSGLIISTKTITKTNEGNVVSEVDSTIKKNILSRLFTTFSPEPNSVSREGLSVYYTWQQELNPGESLDIKIKTNWLFPFIIIVLIVLIVVLTKKYSNINIVMRKKVQFVRAKGGEFALKVSIIVNAKKYIEKVSIIDRLPFITKIHDRFGPEHPSRVDEKNKKIEWNFEKLEQGEVRILSYIIYSKIGVLGKFALPRATAIFERDGEIKEAQSNKTFFLTEQRRKEEDE